jgi:hypothetical protein
LLRLRAAFAINGERTAKPVSDLPLLVLWEQPREGMPQKGFAVRSDNLSVRHDDMLGMFSD